MYGVIGLGQLGESAARHLQLSGHDVIVADSNMDRIEALKDEVSRAVCLDATDEHALRAAGFDDCNAVLMALGENNLEAAVVTAMALVELEIPYIISRATNDLQGKILTKIGIDRVIYPEKRVGAEVAKQLLSPSLNDLVALKNGLVLADLEFPEILRNYNLIDLEWPKRFGITVAGQMTTSDHDQWGSTPRATAPLLQCTRLAVVGSHDEVSAFSEYFAALEAGLREPIDPNV